MKKKVEIAVVRLADSGFDRDKPITPKLARAVEDLPSVKWCQEQGIKLTPGPSVKDYATWELVCLVMAEMEPKEETYFQLKFGTVHLRA